MIIEVNIEEHTVKAIAGNPTKTGYLDGNSQHQALFDHPDGLVCLEGGIILVSDTQNHRIRAID